MTAPVKPRRILMTIDAAGGVWRYAMDLARILKFEGVETVFAGFGPVPSATMLAEAATIGQLRWSEAPLDWMARDRREVAGVPAQLAEFAAAMSVDLLHLNMPSQAAGLETDLPIVAMSHSCVATWFADVKNTALPPDWQWQAELNHCGFQRADAVIAPSRSHANALMRTYGIVDVDVVHNASTHVPRVLNKQNYCLAAGRWWDLGKNAAVLDRTAARAACPIVAVGAAEGGNGERFDFEFVEHRGQVDHPEAMSLLNSAAIFISPSIYEPFGLAALEAARAGAALVLADIPTYRELWEDAALFSRPDDPAGFAAAIDQLTANRRLGRRLALAAQERSRMFSVNIQAKAMLAVYAGALEHQYSSKAAE
jgi:glycosyltransferase involved in cell wall biosynthesis